MADYYYSAGGNLSPSDFGKLMFPQPEDQTNYEYPHDGLLQAYGVVKDNEIRQPQHLDAHGEKVLLVVKHGLTTGTTIGRITGLTLSLASTPTTASSTRPSRHPSCPTTSSMAFSVRGDSGSSIHTRDGRIITLLTGGGGTTGETDVTYGDPYWWIEDQIKKRFPGCHLYQVVG